MDNWIISRESTGHLWKWSFNCNEEDSELICQLLETIHARSIGNSVSVTTTFDEPPATPSSTPTAPSKEPNSSTPS